MVFFGRICAHGGGARGYFKGFLGGFRGFLGGYLGLLRVNLGLSGRVLAFLREGVSYLCAKGSG